MVSKMRPCTVFCADSNKVNLKIKGKPGKV